MPVSAPRVCGHCGGVHQSGERCPKAAARDRERKARFDRKRPNSSQRGYDREWEKAAKEFLAQQENWWCACGAPATVVMHRRSIRTAPHLRMERANWRPGCHRCNAIDAAAERRKLKGK
ncbi:endonuclease [Mesorhizobium sp. PUT5]|uniref:endonuclease n=1 Tax=Mesorhizobium sp. PUT5 TaxID=3454629 RepID=UPI003FA4CC49